MKAIDYMQKATMMCDIFEPNGCGNCPLRQFSCGIPRGIEEQAKALQVVTDFILPKRYICPKCKNEDHPDDAKYCKICGRKIDSEAVG